MKDVYEEAFKRRNDKCDIPLEKVLEELNFTENDQKEIVNMVEKDNE